ncbi:MAG: hypothetical protein V3U03_17410 [Myxococcota bacterium]
MTTSCDPQEERARLSLALMRIESGKVDDDRPLVAFLYRLMRDELTPGRVEEIIVNIGPGPHQFSNGWLAVYAQNMAERLTGRPSDDDLLPDAETAPR